jgi:hypothetical protein
MEENIKYEYAKFGDYKEVQVPLNTVVVGASVIPDETSKQKKKTTQNLFTPKQSTSAVPSSPLQTIDVDTVPKDYTGSLNVNAVEADIGSQEYISVIDDMVYVTHKSEMGDGWYDLINKEATWKIFGKLFKDPRVGWAEIDIYATGLDKYGRPGTMLATRYVMTRETAQKIVDLDDPIRFWRLDNVADYVYINPEIKKSD